eukprot:CAMPEP_0180791838 /NCGR_PEP_ID=MMETSP1038_2-20121128/54049_1 /TAXON_ID=632150 /ORGANISM="Azadinium spinosum, Strain 3D9" /LENGTH=62 /DNA_ID=CAMNT_0022830057 /DNA_START=118 /DNA_END=303 /DNA_ORIENTATION=-
MTPKHESNFSERRRPSLATSQHAESEVRTVDDDSNASGSSSFEGQARFAVPLAGQLFVDGEK